MSQSARSRIWPSVAITLSISVALAGCAKSSHVAALSAPIFSPASAAASAAPSPAASSAPTAPISVAPSRAASSPAAPSSAAAGSPPATPQLTAIALQPSDLPADWAATPHEDDSSSATYDAALVNCVGGRNTDADETGYSNSDDYALDNATITSEATSFRSQADVAADTAIITSPKINACYLKLSEGELADSLPEGATLDTASVAVTPGSAGGPRNVVGTVVAKIEVTVSGQVIDLYINAAFITGPLIEAEIDFTNIGAPVPASLRNSLIAKIAARAGAASAV